MSHSHLLKKDFKNRFFSQRKNEKEKYKFGVQSTYIVLLTLICGMLLYYILMLNTTATKGYNIIKLEEEKNRLVTELGRLNQKIADIESLDTIRSGDDTKLMEPVEDAEYLVVKENVQYVYNN